VNTMGNERNGVKGAKMNGNNILKPRNRQWRGMVEEKRDAEKSGKMGRERL